MFALIVREQGKEERRLFPTGSATIGRRVGNDVQLMGTSVSKEHARIEERRKGCILIDLDSSNGTRVNGLPVEKQLLHDGDVIQVGSTEMVFRSDVSGDLDEEIASAADAMQRGVGYETMLAKITKDQKKKDLAAIRRMAKEGDTALLEGVFLEMGWSESEASRLAEEAKGRPVSEIRSEWVNRMDRPKSNEVILHCSHPIPAVDQGYLVRFKGEEFLVVQMGQTDDGCSYRLKSG